MTLEGRSAEAVEALFEAALIKAGFAELEKRERAAGQEWLSKKSSAEMAQAAMNANRPLLHRRLTRLARRRKVKAGIVRTAPVIGRVAVCLLLIFYLGLTVAVATIEQVRVGLYNFLIHVEDEYTALSIKDSTAARHLPPNGWEGSFYPSYIPDGLVLTAMEQLTFKSTRKLSYENEDRSRWVVFTECAKSEEVNINTENAKVEWLDISGRSCMMVYRENERHAVWSEDDRYFWIWTDNTCDELEEIVDNVKSVR